MSLKGTRSGKRHSARFSKLTTLSGGDGDSIDSDGLMPSGFAPPVPTRFSISGPAMCTARAHRLVCVCASYTYVFRTRQSRDSWPSSSSRADDDVKRTVTGIPNGVSPREERRTDPAEGSVSSLSHPVRNSVRYANVSTTPHYVVDVSISSDNGRHPTVSRCLRQAD